MYNFIIIISQMHIKKYQVNILFSKLHLNLKKYIKIYKIMYLKYYSICIFKLQLRIIYIVYNFRKMLYC